MLRATFALVALCLGLSLVAAQQPAPAPAVTMDDIKKAWQERQDKVKTLKMSWTQKITHPKGSLTARAAATSGPAPSGPQPPKDLLLEGQCNFILSEDGKYSLEIRKANWSIKMQDVSPFHTRTMFDGRDHHVEFLAADRLDHNVVVSTQPQKVKVAVEFRTISTYPIFWTFRGADDKFSAHSLDDYELSGRFVVLGGRRCCELVQKSRSASSSQVLLLDTERGYAPLSLTVTTEKTVTLHLGIEYTFSQDVGLWLPSAWKSSTHTHSGALRESVAVTVTECVPNAGVRPTEFQPSLPPGTHLLDQRNADARVQTVVKDDGTIGRFLPLPASVSYDELREHANSGRSWYHAVLYLSLLLLVLSLSFALVTRRQRMRNSRRKTTH